MQTNDEQLTDLLLKWEEAWEEGEDLSADQLCLECPDLKKPLQNKIDQLKKMGWMSHDSDDSKDEPESDLSSQVLAGRFRLDSLIGSGGFGQVYKAFDIELQRNVAVKLAHKHRSYATDELLNEARRVAKLRHPHIVTVHDVGRHDDSVFIVSDLIEGRNLAEVIEKEKTSAEQAATWVAEIADALQASHDQGIIHRDIKPANILIDKSNRALVTDFGISVTTDEANKSPSSGTLAYMAPEQILSENILVGSKTDLFSLGIVFYELLFGKHPFDLGKGSSANVALKNNILLKEAVPEANSNVQSHLWEICKKCLAKHPTDRFGSAAELARALRAKSTMNAQARRTSWAMPVAFTTIGFLLLGFVTNALGLWTLSKPTQSISSSIPFVTDNVMNFDGRTRIVTELKAFYPCTLESWCRIDEYDQKVAPQVIIGSDIPGKCGISMGVSVNVPCAQIVDQMFYASKSVLVKKWIHLAVVFNEIETRIYMNGSLLHQGPATKPHGDVVFVIGNIGNETPLCYFKGQVRSVRISNGEQYSANFTPEEDLLSDESTELLYNSKSIDGDKANDLSGKGNDGQVEHNGV